MGRVDPETFLTQLTKLYVTSRDKHSVWVTMKRHTVKGTDDVRCLFRATDGKKAKLSTLVSTKEAVRFQIQLTAVFKTAFSSLKKKEKKRAKKRAD
eukprot:EC719606.1.p1 GENE.EC719606.1~~EC719606.1.p1  ORF type:complete len:96 (+),score=2.87 EC719606.1:79-366(+)